MNTPARDFATVDMRGTKAALLAHAQAERVSVSLLVRRAVARELDRVQPSGARGAGTHNTTSTHPTVKLAIRLTSAEAEQLDAGARRAELSRGAFLAGLRHTFAVRRLLQWHAQGADVHQRMLALSTYLGHAKVSNTYWYLSGVPELMSIVGKRFEQFVEPWEGVGEDDDE
jgi:hypothetical protein